LEDISIVQVIAWLVIILIVAGTAYSYFNMRRSLLGVAPTSAPVAEVTPTPTRGTPEPSPPLFVAAATPATLIDDTAVVTSIPLPPPTVPPGRLQVILYPAGNAVGWISNADPLNHFGDRNLHVGIFEEEVYYGAMQFDLSSIPVGSQIEEATLELMGLSAEYLNREEGSWRLQLLDPAADENWRSATYDQIHNVLVLDTIPPTLEPQDLAVRQSNLFSFSSPHLLELERRLETGLVSFRLDGPDQGADNLFTWDTGYGGGFGNRPTLRIIYQPPPTPTPIIIVGDMTTPTPENVVTAAALAATATYEATAIGTPTPWRTAMATVIAPIVVTDTPTPENAATAEWLVSEATAAAFLYGTSTPLPDYVWTATPTPTPTSTPTFIIVTSTATPENLLTAAPLIAMATQVAASIGTYTPVPENWATPIIVTATPQPANQATAEFYQTIATAAAILFGTPTATPMNVWTVTPTPVFIVLDGEIPTPQATQTATATPPPIPAELVGKIAYLSNRAGGDEPLVYVVDPDGSNLALLTHRWPYDLACQRDTYSADSRYRVFTKNIIRYTELGTPEEIPAVFWYDALYDIEQQLTYFGAGYAYQGVWSPTNEQIALVSNDSADDEIWVVDRNGNNLMQLTASNETFNAQQIGKDTFVPEVNRHPSWSPDGSQLVFWSNRTGHGQIWVMDADGSNLYSLSHTDFDDWDPVWIKYTDPPPDPTLMNEYFNNRSTQF